MAEAPPKGRGIRDIPAARRAALDAGAEAATLTECLAVDFAALLEHVLPDIGAGALDEMRQAAAAGFDPVYRRLWDYQLALHEALVDAGALDCVQLVMRRH